MREKEKLWGQRGEGGGANLKERATKSSALDPKEVLADFELFWQVAVGAQTIHVENLKIIGVIDKNRYKFKFSLLAPKPPFLLYHHHTRARTPFTVVTAVNDAQRLVPVSTTCSSSAR